jgi:hypothetical protein
VGRLGFWAGLGATVLSAFLFAHDAGKALDAENERQFFWLLAATLGQATAAAAKYWEVPWLAFVAALTVLVSFLFAWYAAESPYQKFARQSFLGEYKKTPRRQVEELGLLLSHFRVQAQEPAKGAPATLVLQPGAYEARSFFDVRVEARKGGGDPTRWLLQVFPDRRVVQGLVGGGAMFTPERGGPVSEIRLVFPSLLTNGMTYTAWVSLDREGDEKKLNPPMKNEYDTVLWVEVPFDGTAVHSADDKAHKVAPF